MSESALGATAADMRCLVCGQGGIDIGVDAWNAECDRCGASVRSMHLAAMLLTEGSAGQALSAAQFANDKKWGERGILDFTNDGPLMRVLRPHDGYCAIPLFDECSGCEEEFGTKLLDVIAAKSGSEGDILMFRDVLRLVPDLGRYVEQLQSLVRPGGAVIFQDQYRRPFPRLTEKTEPREPIRPRQTVFRAAPYSLYGYEEIEVPVRREIGADFIALLARHGFDAYVHRPLPPVYPNGREMAVVAQSR